MRRRLPSSISASDAPRTAAIRTPSAMAASAASPSWARAVTGSRTVASSAGPSQTATVTSIEDSSRSRSMSAVGDSSDEVGVGRRDLSDGVSGQIRAEAGEHDAVEPARSERLGLHLEFAHDSSHFGELERQPGAEFERRRLLLPEQAEHDLRRLLGGGEVARQRDERRVGLGVAEQDDHPVGVGDSERGQLGLLDLLGDDAVGVDELEQRRRHDRRDDGHHDEHGEQLDVEHLQLHAHLQQDQLGQPTGIHQQCRAPPTAGSGCPGARPAK